MIGEVDKRVGGAGEIARELREQRELLRSVETAALAGAADTLVGVTERLTDLVERVGGSRSRNYVTEEELALEMGYADPDTGEPMKRAFVKAMTEAGVPRHKLTNTRVYYLRDEVEDAIRALDG